MALRKYNVDVPGSYKGPAKCKQKVDGRPCGRDAPHSVSGKAEIMGSVVQFKVYICDNHLEEFKKNGTGSYSLETP